MKKVKEVLGDSVGEVKMTNRLTKSAMALITPEGQMSMNLERLMKAHGQQTNFNSLRVLELNGKHPVMNQLSELLDKKESENVFADAVYVLFNETLIAEGEPVKNPADFNERLTRFIMCGLKG